MQSLAHLSYPIWVRACGVADYNCPRYNPASAAVGHPAALEPACAAPLPVEVHAGSPAKGMIHTIKIDGKRLVRVDSL
jgi:hypothetical protein